jgi:hypothetical protein
MKPESWEQANAAHFDGRENPGSRRTPRTSTGGNRSTSRAIAGPARW